MLNQPISVYINWAAYDELSDTVELTEELAMRQLEELLRLRTLGVRFDYYMMDAFWFASDGGYRAWRKPHWPIGPDAWLRRCLEAGIKPGLWVTANTLCHMECAPAWRDSLDEKNQALCCFYGGYLADYVKVLHAWYERGVRMFKFDFANFDAAPDNLRRVMLPSEIRQANVAAWQGAMKAFRQEHPDVVLIAYNGYENAPLQHSTETPMVKALDLRWLDVFDSLYCGDPRPADVPTMNFWRSKDIYSDHMVRMYEWNGIPLSRIDNSAFMIGTTGTCYYRGTAAWQGMLILSLARGGWVNTYYGNLDLLNKAQGQWFAKVQKIFLELQRSAMFSTFGELPGTGKPYGFSALRDGHGLLTVVNPGQLTAELALPIPDGMSVRILFRDAGFAPELNDGKICLGPEQMVLIGVGDYADTKHDLGIQDDVRIPQNSCLLAEFTSEENQRSLTHVLENPPAEGRLRIVMCQRDGVGPARFSGGSLVNGTSMGQLLVLHAEQKGRDIPVEIAYDKAIWSGLSWAVGEIDCGVLQRGTPVTFTCETRDERPVKLKVALYRVDDTTATLCATEDTGGIR